MSSAGWKPGHQADARSHRGASLLAGCGSGPTGLSAPPTSSSSMPFAFTTDPGMSHETHGSWRRACSQRDPAQPVARAGFHHPRRTAPPSRASRVPRLRRAMAEQAAGRPTPRAAHRRSAHRPGFLGHRDDRRRQPHRMGTAHMVIIGLGRSDPRRWVKAAYAVLDTIESGETDPRDPVPSKAELTRKLSISAHTAGRALRELADMGIVYHVPGHGYFPNTRGEERPPNRRRSLATNSCTSPLPAAARASCLMSAHRGR